ncbi:beta-1,4-mannosyl-glycoprotein 4-beta-N-acetylglucosaminyltransferase [Cylas formicarius]|uniref:beta-1,4-mannosyl-glycoprotein 4-beta-N-acetylglucosaminyltransferase n=1 Tax=Cylas formicarius TaxID=197179 RepID=UPI0029589EA7|nr:beta-1,4-mannosyl-glycoprotein 4-beta-N-acetylglucosaminyltransferase [Cylas formicarius]
MNLFRPNLKKVSLWMLLLTQILLVLSYFYLQNTENKLKLQGISFLTNSEQEKPEKFTYHTLTEGKINLKRFTTREYFINFNSSLCFTGGTDILSMRISRELNWQCSCLPGWHGNDCGYSEVLLRALLANKKPIKLKGPRIFQRRLIYLFKFDTFSEHLTDIRIHELGDIVDLFVIHEPRGSRLKQKMKIKFCQEYQQKILYVEGEADNLWNLVEPYISNLRADDIIFTSHSNEIPHKDALIFLKFYDDFPEPISFRLRRSVYGFFWRHPSKTIISGGACTVSYLRNILSDNLELLASNSSSPNFSQKGIILGDLNHTGGWYCELCGTTDQLVEYLANNSHFVHWDKMNVQKIDIKYLENLIEGGLYIDGKMQLERSHRYSDNNFAPNFALENDWKFDFLLINLYSQDDYYA